MAKKMSTGKIVALALCVIVGAGSIAALARGRDKDEEKEPAHVHSYAESNVCSCGERQETILLSDVKVGMDLSGYSVRLTIPKEEFEERCVGLTYPDDPGGGYSFVGLSGKFYTIYFMKSESDNYNLMFDCAAGITMINSSSGTMQEIPILSIGSSDGSVTLDSTVVLDKRFSSVKEIQKQEEGLEDIEAFSCIEFYYVGLPETDDEGGTAATASTFALNRETSPETPSDVLNGANILLTDKDDSEYWTPFF